MKADWSTTKLSDACLIGETVNPGRAPGVEFDYVDVSSVSNETFSITGSARLLGADAPSRARRKIAPGDVIFATVRPTLRRIAQVPAGLDGAVCSTGFIVLRTGPKLDAKFLFYTLFRPEFMDAMEQLQAGASYPAVTDKQVLNQSIILPPLEEQKRIVAVLDQAFAALDHARALAEANLAEAVELFANVLEERFSSLLQAYPARRLIDFCGDRGVTYGVIKLGDHIPDGVPCLRTSNVRPLAIETDGMKRITTSLSNEYRRTILKGGEVLVNVRGTLGGVSVVPEEMAGWNISCEVAMVDIEGVNPFYVAYFVATRTAQSWLTGVIKGAAYKGINLSDLRELKIPDVGDALQGRLVAELDDIAGSCASLAATCQSKLEDVDHLRQSLLQKAFAGELT